MKWTISSLVRLIPTHQVYLSYLRILSLKVSGPVAKDYNLFQSSVDYPLHSKPTSCNGKNGTRKKESKSQNCLRYTKIYLNFTNCSCWEPWDQTDLLLLWPAMCLTCWASDMLNNLLSTSTIHSNNLTSVPQCSSCCSQESIPLPKCKEQQPNMAFPSLTESSSTYPWVKDNKNPLRRHCSTVLKKATGLCFKTCT
jgi:hypothetical protein